MSFAELPAKKQFAKERIVARVAICTNGPRGEAGVGFTISGDVCAKLGNPSFVKVLQGTGEHRGMILIRPVHAQVEGSYKLSKQSKGKSAHQRAFAAGRNRLGIVKGKIPITPCDYQVTEEGLVVTLPKGVLAPDPNAPKFELLKKPA